MASAPPAVRTPPLVSVMEQPTTGGEPQPSPAFLETFVTAVRDALAADRLPSSSSPPQVQSSPVVTPNITPNSVVSEGTSAGTSGLALPGNQGRSLVFPPFVPTFSAAPVTGISSPSSSSMPTPFDQPSLQSSTTTSPSPLAPTLQQPFIIGPGFLPFDGRLIFPAPPRKPRSAIRDIVEWIEAFSIYSLILTSFFPHRAKDLLLYKLFIIRTYRQFSGQVWLSYDVARQDRPALRNSDEEPKGNTNSIIVCTSWNAGLCKAPTLHCKFAHRCSQCTEFHRKINCPRDLKKQRDDCPMPLVLRTRGIAASNHSCAGVSCS